MKSITRTLLAALAISVMAAPMAQAQQRYDGPRHGHHYAYPKSPSHHAKKKQVRKHAPRHAHRRDQGRSHWTRGKRVPQWQRRHVVRDHHRHNLRRPGPGQHWVKVDNDYLLISLATGIIAGIALNR